MPNDTAMEVAALHYVMENAPVLALRLDADGRILAANAYARRILGPEIEKSAFPELVLGPESRSPLHTLLEEPGKVHMLSLQTASGVPESYHFRFFSTEEGAIALGSLDALEQEKLRVQMLGLNREVNNLARQLHQANAELRQLNQRKNQFLGIVAHDLSRPVSVVMMYAQFLKDETADRLSVEQRGFLDCCLRSAAELQRLIDDFLDVSMIEAGKLRLNLAPTSAAKLLASVAEGSQLLASKKGVTLLTSVTPENRSALVDPAKMQQVLLNLIANATEHSAPGQSVWVSATWEPQALLVSVRDEGPGVAPEDKERLFAPFERLASRNKTGERHAGLGLAIVRMIVEAHGGTIRVESNPGQGATFLISLPAETEAAIHSNSS
jgi:signal transduction histidine kinase